MPAKLLLSILMMLSFNLMLNASDLEICKVTRIIDGDTIEVIYRGDKEKVRLYGIDTPERGEPGYNEATEFTKNYLLNKYIHLSFPDKNKRDHFGRLLAYVIINGGTLFNKILIEEHLAKLYKSTTFEELTQAEIELDISQTAIIDSIILNDNISLLKYLYDKNTYNLQESHRIRILQYVLFIAANYSKSENMIKEIINLGVDINSRLIPAGDNSQYSGVTALHCAAIKNPNSAIINCIISLGANTNSTDDNGQTPLDYAKRSHNTSAITALIKAGADTSIK